MFDNLKNLASLMGQAKELRAKMEKLQEELGRKTVEGDAGAGAVRVVVNGRLEVISVRLDKTMIGVLAGEGASADQGMIEDLIAAATNAGLDKAKEMMKQESAKVMAPGIAGMPGMGGLSGMPGLEPGGADQG